MAADQVSRELTGGAAIVNLSNGVYYGLDEVGTRIWHLMREPVTLGEIRAAIVREYDVDAPPVDADVRAFLTRLAQQGLIEIK